MPTQCKKFKKSNYFKYKKNKKIKKADKKYFNKHFKILESDTIWIDNKKITNPGVDKNGKASTPYGTKKNISDKKFYEQEETNIGGEAVKKLTPGWHTIKLRIYFNTTKNTNYYSSTHLNKNFMYTGKIFVAESVEFVNYYSDHKKNIFPCRTTNDITYKYIGFRMESNFNAKLNTKAVFKVDGDHFIKGAGKKNGFSSDAECLKFLQSNFKEDIVLEKTFDMKPYDNDKIYIIDATDYSIFETIKEKADYKYENIYSPSGKFICAKPIRTSADLFWNCIRPIISVKITSKDSGKILLNKTYTKVNENTSSYNDSIPSEFIKYNM